MAMTCKETSAPMASPYAFHWGGQSWKQQNVLRLSTDRRGPGAEGLGKHLRYLRAASVSLWLVTCELRIVFMTHFSEMLSFWTLNALL